MIAYFADSLAARHLRTQLDGLVGTRLLDTHFKPGTPALNNTIRDKNPHFLVMLANHLLAQNSIAEFMAKPDAVRLLGPNPRDVLIDSITRVHRRQLGAQADEQSPATSFVNS